MILAGTLTGIQGDISCKVLVDLYPDPLRNKITRAEISLTEGCNRKVCSCYLSEVHTYSITALTRTLKGNAKTVRVSGVRVNRVSYKCQPILTLLNV